MTQIDKTKPVLVTGATGYVAGWLVKKLLEEGLTVHAAVRNPDKKEKVAHLDRMAENNPGHIKYFKADLLEEGSYADAMQDCELVFHTASPFITAVDDPQKDLVDPAVKGTHNVLEQANKTDFVKRVVLTSSCVAIYADCKDVENAPNGILTEDCWNTRSSLDYQPYPYSKTLAEQEAWKINNTQNQWDLVVINPSFVIGPATNPDTATSTSFNFFKQLGDGTLKSGVPNLALGVVDVRDVATAHYQAGFIPEANGRNIVSGHNSNFLEMATILHKHYGNQYPVPKTAMPKWILMLIGPMVDKTLTRKFIKNNVNKEWKADHSKSKQELGMEYRSLETSVQDTFQNLIDYNLLKAG